MNINSTLFEAGEIINDDTTSVTDLLKYGGMLVGSLYKNEAFCGLSFLFSYWIGRKIAYALQGQNPTKEKDLNRMKLIIAQNGLIALQLSLFHLYQKNAMNPNLSVPFQFVVVVLETLLYSVVVDIFRSTLASCLPTPYVYFVCPADYHLNN